MELEDMMLLLKAGDKTVLTDIYHMTYKNVYAVAYSVLRNREATKDIVQDTYYHLMLQIRKYKPRGIPRAWLCRIARNLAIDEYRSARRTASSDIYESDLVTGDVFEEVGGVLDTAKQVLSSIELEVMLLHIVSGLSHKESAEIVNKPYATVRWLYAEALRKLKSALIADAAF